MREISIVIPTRNRYKKLKRCLATIPQKVGDINISIIIICDGDSNSASMLIGNKQIDRVIYVAQHRGSVYCRNLATQTVEDALLYATDDIEFLPNSIENAILAMKKHFPDEDGIIGFSIVNANKFSPVAFALMGQKFLRRYPNRKLFYPEYFLFSCQEIDYLATKLGRLHLEGSAKIQHYHPGNIKSEQDQTHQEGRVNRQKDKEISNKRHAEGLIWGESK